MSRQSIEKTFISPDVTETVKMFKAEGLEITASDICFLYELTRKQAEEHSLLSLPVIIEKGYIDDSAIVMHQITPGERIYWDEKGRDTAIEIFGDRQDRVVLMLCWILSSNIGKNILTMSKDKIKSEVIAFSWSVKCTLEVLSVALLRCLGEKENSGTLEIEIKGYNPELIEKTRFEPIAILSSVYNIEPNKLMWEYTENQLVELVNNIGSVNCLKNNLPMGKDTKIDLKSVMTFRGVVEEIKKRLIKEKEDKKDKETK